MPESEEFDNLLQRLQIHRRYLQELLAQQARGPEHLAAVKIKLEIDDRRAEIHKIKETLRKHGVSVKDAHDDEETAAIPPIPSIDITGPIEQTDYVRQTNDAFDQHEIEVLADEFRLGQEDPHCWICTTSLQYGWNHANRRQAPL
jgi:hypothetical protein